MCIRKRRWLASCFTLVFALTNGFMTGCREDESAREAVESAPIPISDQEGAVCGMLLREQSAPRSQVVHRDGERSFLCSIGDLLAYMSAPSPHGAPVRVLVEVLQPSQDPAESHTGAHPWIDAEAGVYVVGIERPQIMGAPVLIYRDRAAAEQMIAGTSAKILRWEDLGPWWAAQQGDTPD
jgi:nitrous oxide reductase accessory protein NosL